MTATQNALEGAGVPIVGADAKAVETSLTSSSQPSRPVVPLSHAIDTTELIHTKATETP